MNDPLIPTPPAADPQPGTPRTTRAQRAKHPAMSARILATGLAATGMLGMTAGYAFAQKENKESPVLDNGQLTAADAQFAQLPPAPAGNITEQQPAPLLQTPQHQAPQQRVIQVPVQPPVAADPGPGAGSGNWTPAPTQQQSSGSN